MCLYSGNDSGKHFCLYKSLFWSKMIKMVQNGFWGTFYKNILNYFLVETWLNYKLCAFWDICDYGVFRYEKHVEFSDDLVFFSLVYTRVNRYIYICACKRTHLYNPMVRQL